MGEHEDVAARGYLLTFRTYGTWLGGPVWSRHGSTVYLWNDEARERAIWYVEQEQDG